MPPATPKRSFFKRQLPVCLASFTSDKGRQLFREALEEGNAEAYFTLAGCFATQDDPAFCGLSTLSIALNALEVDPLRVWKGAWRWFSDDMLDCCRSLEDVRQKGITLSEFACIARCNGLEEKTIFADEHATLEQFEADLQRVCADKHQVLAISYSRAVLEQTGSGHFSPVGAYCATQRMALVLDVARFKYPAYWVPIELLWASLKPIDPDTGRSRGYSILSRRLSSRTDPYWVQVGLNKYTWSKALLTLRDDSTENTSSSDTAPSLHTVLKALINAFPKHVVHRRTLPLQLDPAEPVLIDTSSDASTATPNGSLIEISTMPSNDDDNRNSASNNNNNINNSHDSDEAGYRQLLIDIQQQTAIYEAVKNIYAQQHTALPSSTSSAQLVDTSSEDEEQAILTTLIPLAMVQGLSGLLSASSQVKLCTLANGCGVNTPDNCCSKTPPITMSNTLKDEVAAIREQLLSLTTLALDEGLISPSLIS